MSYELKFGNMSSLSKAEQRFALFLKKVEMPITEEKIVDYYYEYVAGVRGFWGDKWYRIVRDEYGKAVRTPDGHLMREYVFPEKHEIKQNALQWFDHALGRAIRKSTIQENGIKILTSSLKSSLRP